VTAQPASFGSGPFTRADKGEMAIAGTCLQKHEQEMKEEIAMKSGNRVSGTAALVAGCVSLCWGVTAAAQVIEGVMFTTVAPTPPYQTVGIVSAISHVPPAILDPSKPFKEAIQRLYPDLARQAKTRGADLVVLTQVVPILGRDDAWLLVFGTALRSTGESTPPSSTGGTLGQPSAAVPAAKDLSGTWVGKVLETGEDTPVDLTLNLVAGASPDEYTGGYILADPACEVTVTSSGREGDVYIFKGERASKLRCALFASCSAQLTAEGTLDFKIYGASGKKVHMQGPLTRR